MRYIKHLDNSHCCISVGAATLGAAAIGALGGYASNKSSAKSAARSIAFQREMAQNAHQYEVEDLRKAGLNPILSAGGSGAKASGGAQYKAENVLENAVQSALAIKRTEAEIGNINADTKKKINEARITETPATVADKLLTPVASALDAARQGYDDGREIIKRIPRALSNAKTIAKDRVKTFAYGNAPRAEGTTTTTTRQRKLRLKAIQEKRKGYYYKGQWYDL